MAYDRVEGKFYPFIEDTGTTVSSTKYSTLNADGTITTTTSAIDLYSGAFYSKQQYERSLYDIDNTTYASFNYTDSDGNAIDTTSAAISFTRPSYDTTGVEYYVHSFDGFTEAQHTNASVSDTTAITTYTVEYDKRNVRAIRLLDSQGDFVRYVLKNCDGYFDGKYYNIMKEGVELVDS
jgi:hypothetical protein